MSLAVPCTVCNKAIKEDCEKVMCFGPCGRITHLNCSGEVDKQGYKAISTNIGVKYLCHGCRKTQCSLNSILEKCDETMKMVEKWKSEIESRFEKMEENLTSKFKEELSNVNQEISLLSGKMNEKSNENGKNLTKPLQCSEEKNGKTQEEISPANSNRILRSQSQKQKEKEKENEKNEKAQPEVTAVLDSTALFTTVLKKGIAKKKENVIIVKPKAIDQTVHQTKQVLRNRIDRATNNINVVRDGNSGSVILGVKQADHVETIVKSVQEKLGENYEVSIPKPKKPRLKIIGVEDKLSESELNESLKEQNEFLEELELKLITTYSRKNAAGYESHSYVLEVDATSHEIMLEAERVNLGWERCKVIECFGIMRCFKCCGYGHKSMNCKGAEACAKCAGQHRTVECTSDEARCVNCERMNKERRLELSTDHFAFSHECAMYKRLVARKRQQIDHDQ